ncbi:MAG: hypothetical protein ACD_58C00015G0005 [uncultured bacterium]|nr:MAG: hypothetical protein ACD_58C00015G0005 [uncultured bacterium]
MEGPNTNNLFYASGWIYEIAKGIFLTIAIILVMVAILGTIYVVDGVSMDTSLKDRQYVLVEKLSYLTGDPHRGDIVVLRFPGDPDKKKYIKRIIGMPGDTLEIKNGQVYINNSQINEFYLAPDVRTLPDQKIVVLADEYFVIGDNRDNSNDSRIWGTCPKNQLIGRAWIIFLPTRDFTVIPEVEYNL